MLSGKTQINRYGNRDPDTDILRRNGSAMPDDLRFCEIVV
jgi:hypothetical protein